MHALERFIREKPSGCLYHYTGAAGLIGIIENRKLWATDHRHLNDRKEHQIGTRLLQDELKVSRLEKKDRSAFEDLVASTQKGYFVLSFSEQGDQLSQWRAYSAGGAGYALGFKQNNALFSSATQHSFNLIRCEYDPTKQQELCRYLVDSFIEGMVTHQSLHQENDMASRLKGFRELYHWNLALALAMSALKHQGFEEEKEWRLVSQYPDEIQNGVSFRPGRFGLTPYFELPICLKKEDPCKIDEITIGPSSNRTAARTALDLLLSRTETEVGHIRISCTPLRQ
jgi:hypothetical protein